MEIFVSEWKREEKEEKGKKISREKKTAAAICFAKDRLWIHLILNFFPKYQNEEICSSFEGG